MVLAVFSLVAGEAAFFTERFGVEPVTVGVELGFDEVCGIGNRELPAKFGGLIPSGAFNFEAFNVGRKVIMAKQGVAELVEDKEREI